MKGWRCRRTTKGVLCNRINAPRTRKCAFCGKPKLPKRKPTHMRALEMTYEDYVELNGGEFCGICGKERKPGERRLHRDHDHRTKMPRGVLCFRCNVALRPYMTAEWCRSAWSYLETAKG